MRDVWRAIEAASSVQKTVERLHRDMDFGRVAKQVEDILQTGALERFAQNYERQQRQIEAMADGHGIFMATLDAAAERLRLSESTIEKWATAYAGQDVLKASLNAVERYDALFRTATFQDIADQIDRLRPLVTTHLDAIRTAPNEEARRLTALSAVRAVVEGATGLDWHLESPEKVIKFISALIRLLFMFTLTTQHSYRTDPAAVLSVREEREVARQQAETIASLTFALNQVQEHLIEATAEPVVILRTTERAVLREGPSGASPRLATLPAGRRVQLKSSYERWRWVEILTDAGVPTGARGWVYRGALRLD